MRKLRLDLEELAVESFETRVTATPRGTVRGQQSGVTYCVNDTCNLCVQYSPDSGGDGEGTSRQPYTCVNTCWWTCYSPYESVCQRVCPSATNEVAPCCP